MYRIRNYILKEVSERRLSKEEAKKMLLEMNHYSTEKQNETINDISVIGMSVNLLGADTLNSF